METLIVPVEIRQDESRQSPGLLSGVLLTYETRAQDRAEMFSQDAMRWPKLGFNINAQHNRAAPVVRVIPFVEGRELRVLAALPNTAAGRDAAENIREGVYTGLSVEFAAEVETREAGYRRIKRAFLGGAALVDSPSYGDSLVEVRAEMSVPAWKVYQWL